MSKAGAVAMREISKMAEIITSIGEKGLREVAREAYEREEAERVEKAKRSIVRLLKQAGLPEAEPFVLDDFPRFAPHQRVCVEIDGLKLNYWKGDRKYSEELQLIAGRCTKCGELPALLPVKTIADLAKPDLPYYRRRTVEYVCSDCKDK